MMEKCDCHKRNDDSKKSKNAVLRLIFACVLAMMFVIGEFIGNRDLFSPYAVPTLFHFYRWIFLAQSSHYD